MYFDRINIDGSVGPAKHAYNSGQMMQSAAIQYKLTKDTVYLIDAQKIAKSCYDYFFRDYVTASGKQIRLLKKEMYGFLPLCYEVLQSYIVWIKMICM